MDDTKDHDHSPHKALKAARKQRGMTLAQLSERTGLPVSSISKIENGRMSLSFDKIQRLCRGLEIDIASLFGGPADRAEAIGGRRSVNRLGEGEVIDTENYHYRYLSTDLLNKRFVPVTGEVLTRCIEDFGALITHPGEEFTYVLEGALELHTSEYAPVRLEAGESVHFDSTMGHAYIAVGDQPCRVITICSDGQTQWLDGDAQ